MRTVLVMVHNIITVPDLPAGMALSHLLSISTSLFDNQVPFPDRAQELATDKYHMPDVTHSIQATQVTSVQKKTLMMGRLGNELVFRRWTPQHRISTLSDNQIHFVLPRAQRLVSDYIDPYLNIPAYPIYRMVT